RRLANGRREIPPHVLGEEGHYRRDHAHRLDERVPERPERRLVEGVEALARAADGPGGEIVREAFPCIRDIRRPEALVGVGRLLHELLRPREKPAVERTELLEVGATREVAVRRLEPLDVRVEDEERGRVPERKETTLDLVRR